MKQTIFILLLLGSSLSVAAQFQFASAESPSSFAMPRVNFGLEAQGYEYGGIFGMRADVYPNSKNNINLRFGYNFVSSGRGASFKENGGGLGVGVGYRRFTGKRKGLFVGARADFWSLQLDLEDFDTFSQTLTKSEVTLMAFQPTVEGGFQFVVKKHWVVAPALAFGHRFSVKTEGGEVPARWITLVGVNINYKLF